MAEPGAAAFTSANGKFVDEEYEAALEVSSEQRPVGPIEKKKLVQLCGEGAAGSVAASCAVQISLCGYLSVVYAA